MNKLIVALLAGFFCVASFAKGPAGGHGQVAPIAPGVAPHKAPAKQVHKTVRKTTKKIVKSVGK